MPLYYTLRNITVEGGENIPRDTLTGLDGINPQPLIEAGAVREIRTPPVSIMHEWQEYDTILADAGFRTLGDLIVTDIANLNRLLGTDVADLVARTRRLLHPRTATTFTSTAPAPSAT